MTVELPTSGEQFEAYLVEDRYGVLWVQEASPRPDRRKAQAFSLIVVLKLGWRIVRPSLDERIARERIDGFLTRYGERR